MVIGVTVVAQGEAARGHSAQDSGTHLYSPPVLFAVDHKAGLHEL